VLHEPIRRAVASARNDGPPGTTPVTRQCDPSSVTDNSVVYAVDWWVALTGRRRPDPTARQVGPCSAGAVLMGRRVGSSTAACLKLVDVNWKDKMTNHELGSKVGLPNGAN